MAGRLVPLHLLAHRGSHYADLSAAQFLGLLHIGHTMFEYTTPLDRAKLRRGQKDVAATCVEEIHPARWCTWESRATTAEALGLRDTTSVNNLWSALRATGDIHSVPHADSLPGKETYEHRMIDRVAAREHREAQEAAALDALADQTLWPAIDDETPENAREALTLLVARFVAEYSGEFGGKVHPEWRPNDHQVAESIPKLVAGYVGVEVPKVRRRWWGDPDAPLVKPGVAATDRGLHAVPDTDGDVVIVPDEDVSVEDAPVAAPNGADAELAGLMGRSA